MTDNNEFIPFKPEQKVTVVITRREALLLYKLRKYPYGKFTVHKIDNKILRVENNISELIDENIEFTFD